MVSVVPSARQCKLRLVMQLAIYHVRSGIAGEALTESRGGRGDYVTDRYCE